MPNSQKELLLIQPNLEQYGEAIYTLLGMHFRKGIDTVCRNGRIAHSHIDWDVSRIGLFGDQLITYWGVYKLQMRIGTARVKTAGINLPVTHPDFRGQGLMSQTINNSLRAMRDSEYGLSVINNTHAYFMHFGYVFAWPQTYYFVKTQDLPMESPTLSINEVNAYDIMGRSDCADIYNRQNATVTGTCVRPTYLRSKHPHDDFIPGFLLENDSGQVVGYIFDSPPQIAVQRYWHDDSAGDTTERLRVLGLLARRQKCEGVYFERLPYASDLATYLRQMNCTVTIEYRSDGGYLIRIINLETTLRSMEKELAQRVANSYLSDWDCSLLIRCDDQKVVLHINQSHVTVGNNTKTHHSVEGDQYISQLLIGTYPPMEIVRNHGIVLNGRARELIEVLFPHQHPQMPNQAL